MSPVNSHNVCLASIPEVPSNTCNRFLNFKKKSQMNTSYSQRVSSAKKNY
jgi:hypothetical protein